MHRREVLARATKASGTVAAYYHLWHAQKIGKVDQAETVGGWKDYQQRHVQQLVEYLKTYSRKRCSQ